MKRFSEDDLQHDSRFASKLLYNSRKITGNRKKLLPVTGRGRMTDEEDYH